MSGGGGESGVQRIEPASYQLPYLQYGLDQAHSLYGQGPTVVPFSPQTEQAMQMTEQRAMQGSPVTRSAQDYVTRSLQGGFMGSNPYLDATFNKAALATQNSLDSQYARAGRNVRAGEPVRAQQLNDLATSIYGGNYQFERGMQQGTLPYVSPLAAEDYNDINALASVGGRVEDLAQDYANAPYAALGQYLGSVRGTDYGTTQVGPTQQRNQLGGALGGAAAGSAFGPWGTLIGGALGGIFG